MVPQAGTKYSKDEPVREQHEAVLNIPEIKP